jgi:hypothetical protein
MSDATNADRPLPVLSSEGVRPPAEKLERLEALLRAMQADAVTYLTPGSGCGSDWFVSRMLWHLDGPEQRAAQGIPE